ncbi:putative immunity protein [Streptomyces sp. enrichment culture]|uniref:putative immunity protein n=1 Tax=Streptomyces sp. enrichment culture TaxID=1795815 RepID=UPI003F57E681
MTARFAVITAATLLYSAMDDDGFMPGDEGEIALSMQDLREVTAFAAACAAVVLEVFEADQPDDSRPRDAIAAAWEFARGGRRGKSLRDTAWAALKAAKSADTDAAREAARAAMSAAGAAYLHPLAKATQVKHILGAAAHAARAAELAAGDDPGIGAEHVERAGHRATPVVVEVLERFPAAPGGGGRVGELTRMLDADLRSRNSTESASV